MYQTDNSVIYTFSNITNFNIENLETFLINYNIKIKFNSYSNNNELNIIFDKPLTEQLELTILNFLV